jgi:hypothetical protein
MAAPLNNCTTEEQHTVVCFLLAEGIKSAEIHCWMLAQYGACTVQQQDLRVERTL